MHTDHCFHMGADHTVCQDFAVSGIDEVLKTERVAYAIVCDGCSSSPDTDFGARLLAISAREHARCSYLMSYDSLAEYLTHRMKIIYDTFYSLHPQALDATLLLATVRPSKGEKHLLHVFMYGDGVCYVRAKNNPRLLHVGFEVMDGDIKRSAPDYLSYHLSASRKKVYLTSNVSKKATYGDRVETLHPFAPVCFSCEVESGDFVALSSDGIDSFRTATEVSLTTKEVADEFFGFKNTNGEFVKRRISAFKRQCTKNAIVHGDDISVAAIIV